MVPEAGFKNYDIYEDNVHGLKSIERESNVKRVLQKLPPESISFRQEQIGFYDDQQNESKIPEMEVSQGQIKMTKKIKKVPNLYKKIQED